MGNNNKEKKAREAREEKAARAAEEARRAKEAREAEAAALANREPTEAEKAAAKKDKKKEIFSGVVLVYIAVCFLITAIASEKQFLTYGQLSVLFLPLYVMFIIWMMGEYHDPHSRKHPSKLRAYLSCGMCAAAIIITIIYNIAHWLGH